MLRNYLKIALRSLLRNKGYTAVSIVALSVGIAVCLVIFIVVQYESGFDNFHHKKGRIYRVVTRFVGSEYNGLLSSGGVPAPLSATIGKEFPQLEKTAGITSFGAMQVQVLNSRGEGVKKFKSRIFYTEPSFFEMFDFKWLSGNPAETLNDPGSAAVTKETAEKYFGDWKQALGKTIKIDDKQLLKISGIIATVPENTDFQLEVVASYRTLNYASSKDWFSVNSANQCYILTPPDFSVPGFDARLDAFSKKYRTATDKNTQFLQPLSEVHYDAVARNYSGKTISRQSLRTLWLIAAFILLIACVNFINLSTAQAVNRAKEVGVRKALGSYQFQLTLQFLLETLLLVVAAVIAAVIIAGVSLQAIGKILDDPLSLKMLYDPTLLLFLVIVTLAVTILAGCYPSLVLSAFKPIAALKGRISARSNKGLSLRRVLVVFQFVIAQALIIATLVILKQMNYFRTASMGFNTNAVVDIPFPNDSAGIGRLDYLRDRLLAIKGVQQVSFSSDPPARGKEKSNNGWTSFSFNNARQQTDFFSIMKFADANYINTYQLRLVAGRNMTATDSVREFIINETLVKKLGFSRPEDILNKEIDLWDGYSKGPVVGVVKDFHLFSLKDELAAPVFITNVKRSYTMAGIKLIAADMFNAMPSIEKLWNEAYPSYVFEYQFLDDRVAGFYKQESQLSQLYQLFAGIAIFLSCLGLFGLASFMAIQRTKEVGIRKVLGATEKNIVYIFSKEFIILIVIAFAIASPIAWYVMQQWLQNYAYRTMIGWQVFITGGLASLLIALATISYHAVRTAMANPVKSLRSE